MTKLSTSPERSTEDDYQHFLAYSGLEHTDLLRYAYFHGADADCDKPKIEKADPVEELCKSIRADIRLYNERDIVAESQQLWGVVRYEAAGLGWTPESEESLPDWTRRMLRSASRSETPKPDEVIANIIEDIRGRRGLRQEWENIDVDIRNEIVAEWREFFK